MGNITQWFHWAVTAQQLRIDSLSKVQAEFDFCLCEIFTARLFGPCCTCAGLFHCYISLELSAPGQPFGPSSQGMPAVPRPCILQCSGQPLCASAVQPVSVKSIAGDKSQDRQCGRHNQAPDVWQNSRT
jgi:hypothetical protein